MNRSGLWLGATLIVIGGLLLLDNMYIVDFGDVLQTYWPVLLIIWGLSKISRQRPEPEGSSGQPGQIFGAKATVFPGTNADRLSSSTVFGDYIVSVQSKAFAGGSVSSTFGNTEIDLSNAELADGEQSLNLDGVFGNTTVHLPKGMAFAIYANTTFGRVHVNDQRKDGVSSSLDFVSVGFQDAKKRIRISASRVFGNVVVMS